MASGRIIGFGFTTQDLVPDLSNLDAVLGRIEDSGAGFAELALLALDVIAGGRVLPERRRKLEQICARRQLGYTVHGPLTLNFMDAPHLALHKQVCRANLELAGAVGARVVVVHAGIVQAQPEPILERLYAMQREALAELGEVARAAGTRLAVENLFVEEPGLTTPSPARLATELRAIDHPYVVGTLDFSHAYLLSTLCGLDFENQVRAFAPAAGHLHVHDSFGRPPTIKGWTPSENLAFGMGDLHLPPGWGEIPFATLLPGLPVRDGTVMTVELPGRFWSDLDAVAATARDLVELA
jgi:sugar phosphate isomerase/epimerase